MEAGLDDYLMGTESHAFRCAEFVAFWASTEAIGLAGFAEGPIGELSLTPSLERRGDQRCDWSGTCGVP